MPELGKIKQNKISDENSMTLLQQSCWKIGTSTTNLKHALGVTMGVFLVNCGLCCARDFDSGCWEELMDDETSSRYISLLMLLLIPFLVISLSIKALIIMLTNISPLMIKLLYFERSGKTNNLPNLFVYSIFINSFFPNDSCMT